MTQNESFATFQRALDQRFSDLSQALKDTIDAFSIGNMDKRIAKATELHRATRDLFDFLAENDRPPWLQPILNDASHFLRYKDPDHAKKLLDVLVKNHHKVRPIQLDVDAPPTVDFDALYRRFRDEGRIPQLFDDLIEIVTKIINSGEVDSLTALQALQQIVQILRANQHGSYLAVRKSITLSRYLSNLAKIILNKIPVVAEAIEAYDMTIDELDNEFASLDANLNRAIATSLTKSIPHIDRLPEYWDQTILLLPSPSEDDSENHHIVEAGARTAK